METIPRKVVLDLLPAYMAGEVSEDTKAFVEDYAKDDPQIARLIQNGITERASTPRVKSERTRSTQMGMARQLLYFALATGTILVVPFIANQFDTGFNWSFGDFIVAAILLFGSSVAYTIVSRLGDTTAYRAGVGVAVLGGLLLVWVNGAVGIIGSEDNPANILYAGVLAVGAIGAAVTRFESRGMSYALYSTALAQALVPVAAYLIWRPEFSSQEALMELMRTIGANSFFVALFAVSGTLFRRASGPKYVRNS